MAFDFTNPTAVIAAYRAHYVPQDQGPTSACVWCDWTAAAMGWSLFVANNPLPQLSWPFCYVSCVGEATFHYGFDPLSAGARLQTRGFCADALYSQDFVLSHWQNGAPYPAEYLPSPAAYADASSRLLLNFGAVRMSATTPGAADWDEMIQLMRDGYPLVYGNYGHSMCILPIKPKDDFWFYALNSNIGNADPNGLGPGIQYLARDQLYWNPFYVQQVQFPSIVLIPPAGGPLSTQADVLAAIHAVGPWSPTAYANLVAAVGAEAPVVIPPASMTCTDLQSALVDATGVQFTWGEFLNAQVGARVLVNGQAQLAATSCVIVNGQVRCNDVGYGSWRQYPGWTVVSAP